MDPLTATNLSRRFTVRESRPGFSGAVRGLFFGRTKRVKQAVDGMSFAIKPGEILGLIGPNGSGKSTIVKMATGLIQPSGGEIRTFGLDPFKHRIEVSRRYGVVFGQRTQLWYNLSARETFTALGSIYDIDARAAARQAEFLVETLQLRDFFTTPVRQLSLGQRVRCDIAAALLHKPELLFLDEPTIGVDILAKERLRTYIRQINAQSGVSVLLTSHEIVDIEQLSDRVIVIDKGKIAFEGQLDDLRRRFATERRLTLDFKSEPAALDLPSLQVLSRDGVRLVLCLPASSRIPDILQMIPKEFEVVDLSVSETPMDEVIAHIYRHMESAPASGQPTAAVE
jgi:ABC-2 type transport system ATP-binding protein